VASTRVADDDGSDVRGAEVRSPEVRGADVRGAADGVEVADDGTTGTTENLDFEIFFF
jgi:hypothetical protein